MCTVYMLYTIRHDAIDFFSRYSKRVALGKHRARRHLGVFKRFEDPRPKVYLAELSVRDPECPVSGQLGKVSVRRDKRTLSRKCVSQQVHVELLFAGSGAPLSHETWEPLHHSRCRSRSPPGKQL